MRVEDSSGGADRGFKGSRDGVRFVHRPKGGDEGLGASRATGQLETDAMRDDYRARRNFTNEQIERFAEEFRVNNIEDVDQIDIMKCIEIGWIWTLKGTKKLSYIEVEDYVLGDRDAEATSDAMSAVIRAKKSVGQSVGNFLRHQIDSFKARRGVFTLTHELGHVCFVASFDQGEERVRSQQYRRAIRSSKLSKAQNGKQMCGRVPFWLVAHACW